MDIPLSMVLTTNFESCLKRRYLNPIKKGLHSSKQPFAWLILKITTVTTCGTSQHLKATVRLKKWNWSTVSLRHRHRRIGLLTDFLMFSTQLCVLTSLASTVFFYPFHMACNSNSKLQFKFGWLSICAQLCEINVFLSWRFRAETNFSQICCMFSWSNGSCSMIHRKPRNCHWMMLNGNCSLLS